MKGGELAYEAGDSQPRYAAVPYDSTTMRWWRLHDDAGMWTASYSEDGLSDWVVFGQRPAPDTLPVTVAVLTGLFIAMPDTTGVAHYGRLLVCD